MHALSLQQPLAWVNILFKQLQTGEILFSNGQKNIQKRFSVGVEQTKDFSGEIHRRFANFSQRERMQKVLNCYL